MCGTGGEFCVDFVSCNFVLKEYQAQVFGKLKEQCPLEARGVLAILGWIIVPSFDHHHDTKILPGPVKLHVSILSLAFSIWT